MIAGRRLGPGRVGRARFSHPEAPEAALAVAAGASAVALSSRGDVVVLGLLVAVLAARAGGRSSGASIMRHRWFRALTGAGALLGVCGAGLRWGDGSLDAIAGAQSVLGAAVTIGPAVAATSAGLGALAVLAGASRPKRSRAVQAVSALAVGASSAVVAWGPGPGDRLWQRVAATAVATIAALALARARRQRRRLDLAAAVVAVPAGIASVACALLAPGGWTVRSADLAQSVGEGVVVAAAAAALAVTTFALVRRAGDARAVSAAATRR